MAYRFLTSAHLNDLQSSRSLIKLRPLYIQRPGRRDWKIGDAALAPTLMCVVLCLCLYTLYASEALVLYLVQRENFIFDVGNDVRFFFFFLQIPIFLIMLIFFT